MRSADSDPVSQVLFCQTSFEKGKRTLRQAMAYSPSKY